MTSFQWMLLLLRREPILCMAMRVSLIQFIPGTPATQMETVLSRLTEQSPFPGIYHFSPACFLPLNVCLEYILLYLTNSKLKARFMSHSVRKPSLTHRRPLSVLLAPCARSRVCLCCRSFESLFNQSDVLGVQIYPD